jgi:hypothetical protein
MRERVTVQAPSAHIGQPAANTDTAGRAPTRAFDGASMPGSGRKKRDRAARNRSLLAAAGLA